MRIFDKIFDKLGFGKRKIFAPTERSGGGGGYPSSPVLSGGSSTAPAAKPAAVPAAAPVPVPISEVDVMSKLEAMAAESKQKLNWKTSIVDLMKLLGLDSSLAERKELAKELGCPPEKMGDSAAMNMWLHKAVLTNIARNGGNIPANMLD